ncbi:baculoviral IAP repeat-containing protein 2/3 [Mytilus galloprovincialis]|nr:baculoviral IAP repeat-containing protein 2/3 [Mytilus galloprovincialis]
MCQPRLFQRSFSDTGQGPLMLSRSVQTDLTPESTCLQDTDDTHENDTTRDKEDEKGYEKVCSDLKELDEKVQQLTLALNLSGPAKIPEIINRLKTFAKIKEHSTNLRLTIERLETMADKTMSSDMEHIINHQEFMAIRYSTALKNIDTVSKVQNESSLQKNKDSYNVLGDLLRLRTFPHSQPQLCPFSLTNYFESISSGTPVSHGESMSNELLRLSSYSSFPREININLIKMAKTGFYYIDGRKTKCFSCGITYDKWKSGDDPVVIHKMLSPSCALVAEPRFSSSANQEERTTVVSNNTDSTVDTRTVTSQGLNQSENASSTYEPRLQISSSYNGTSNNVQERQGNQQSSPSNRDRSSSATGNSQETQTSKENKNATGTSSCQHNTEFESLGIHLEKPKYPNYACLTVRISSFEGWPSYLDQSPRQMALAGFLFAGYHDYTRCFFCGGGLRNWEAGDDPWVEHARWFPKCTFLKQNKGEKFINAVQKRQEEIDRETNATTTQETTPRAQTSSLAVYNSTTSTTQSDILQTVAGRSVIEMGYTDQQVINAFQHLTTSGKDMNSISATDIMHILLDDEAHPQQQGATSDVTRNENNMNTAGDHKSDSTSTQCNGLDNTVIEQNLLFDDTENLIEENRQLRDQRLCKVCLDLEASIAFLPCGHIVCCIDCAPAMRKCPVCRTYVKGTVKTYLA